MAMITDRVREESLGIQWPASPHPLRWATAGAFISNLITNLFVWLDRARERRQLLSLSDRALQDFGRSRADAAGEGDRPFWRA
ncbi:MAG: DUF1127 domain-containing protein [Rhodospirillales bacterium]|nr:DUF1127 domain-containing protein [Rhodospirillales bacterium]